MILLKFLIIRTLFLDINLHNIKICLFPVCDEPGGSSYHLLSRLYLNQLCSEGSSIQNLPLMSNDTANEVNSTIESEENADNMESRRILFMPSVKRKRNLQDGCWPRLVVVGYILLSLES